jgi:hypothetical protein
MPAAAAAAVAAFRPTTKLLARCTVAVTKKAQNVIHVDRYMTRSDLIMTTKPSTTASKSTSATMPAAAEGAAPVADSSSTLLQRGSMCVQLETPSTTSVPGI